MELTIADFADGAHGAIFTAREFPCFALAIEAENEGAEITVGVIFFGGPGF